jgi:hypothetical protein
MSKQKEHQEKQEDVKKVETRYERRLARRKKEAQKQEMEVRIAQISGLILLAVLVGLLISFPIRSYMAVHQTYVVVDNENVSRLEYDFNYYSVLNNYISQYGSYLSYFGLDITQDLSTQMYSDTMTWKDYFDQMAIESIKQGKALMKDAANKGYTYDTTEDFKILQESMKEQAKSQSITDKEFLQTMYGPYATIGRLSPYLKDTLFLTSYYLQLDEELSPTDEEIQAYYEEHKEDYDSIDFRMTEVSAVLPTEPTDAADDDTAEDGAETAEDSTETTDEAYQPTDEEIAAAMAEAKIEADALLPSISTDGTLQENVTRVSMTSAIREWMFDSVRKEGDTEVLEDSTGHKYYVVEFVKRYLDETLLVDARVIAVDPGVGQGVLDEWKAGDATEDSFIALYREYDIETTGLQDNGGLFSGLSPSGMQEDMSAWLFAEDRKGGDTTAISTDTVEYVIYYVGLGNPEWKESIKSTLLEEATTNYVEDLTATITVEDPKGNLPYLRAEEEASQAAETAAETSAATVESTEETQTSTTAAAQ